MSVPATLLLILAISDVTLEAERPKTQRGSLGRDAKAAAFAGEVLGREFGGAPGHFAEYEVALAEPRSPGFLNLRHARALPGSSHLQVSLDGNSLGALECVSTGGWGEEEDDFLWTSLALPAISAGTHTLRLTLVNAPSPRRFPPLPVPASAILDRVGRRDDKNSVGHGNNVALYTGSPSRFFFATHELGNVFSAADGGTLDWYPDHVLVSAQVPGRSPSNVNLDRLVLSDRSLAKHSPGPNDTPILEQRQVCVTSDDVVISRIHCFNASEREISHTLEIRGDCRASCNWRGQPGGTKETRQRGDSILLFDGNGFPDITGGLFVAIGANESPASVDATVPGCYRAVYTIKIPAQSTKTLTLACAIGIDQNATLSALEAALKLADPIASNRRQWERFFEQSVPRFTCSDPGLEELYAFRWFLLKFSTAGGALGNFMHPVVLEGRQAYQTYCCYSAPFLAFDLNWCADPQVGFGHLACMVEAQHDDGRFPWYTSPDSKQVPIHHRSGTGLSLLPYACWKHYLVHGNKELLERLLPGLQRNVEWWLKDRDEDHNGLMVIDHQLETGMDDLLRWSDPTLRYESVDATCYAFLNLQAVSRIASELGHREDAERYRAPAERSERALLAELYDAEHRFFRDRHPDGERSSLLCVTTFYPAFAHMNVSQSLECLRAHLLEPEEFWLPHPVPALAKNQPAFDPVSYWQGPSWPAATSHVLEGFASLAKRRDRSLLPAAAELFRRAAGNHLQPRADFYERYDPLSGRPLSTFRDYMHSWWIDLYIRHVAGLEIEADGSLVVDPLPLGLTAFAIEGVPFRGRSLDLSWNSEDRRLVLRVDGSVHWEFSDFVPGSARLAVPRLP